MQELIYDFGISIYHASLQVASLFNEKAKRWVVGRIDIFNQLKSVQWKSPYWFHCASVGEFEQGLPCIQAIEKQFPSAQILVTFFSPSGYEYARKKYPNQLSYYLPIDTKSNAKQFFEIVQPRAAFFIKYEFWFHYLHELKENRIRTFLISGIFRKEQPFFNWYGSLHRDMLYCFTYLFLQNEASLKLIESMGIKQAGIFGDTRFDRVNEIKHTSFQDHIIEEFIERAPVFVAGSVWNSDDEALLSIIKNIPSHWKIILAPHEFNHYSHSFLKEEVAFYSSFKKNSARILILDTVGILSRVYRVAKFAYIGGGFGKGIHNILEASIYEIPVVFGPNYHKFNEAVEFIEKGIAFQFDAATSHSFIELIIQNDEFYDRLKSKCAAIISSKTNVSEKIIVFLNDRQWLI